MEQIAGFVAFVRDVIIIILGIIWIIAGVLVAIVAWLSWKFVRSLPRRSEMVTAPAKDLLGQAQQAVGTAGEGARTAKEAVTFVSEKAVMPTILVVSAVAGARRFVEILLGGPKRDGRGDAA